MWGGPRGAKAVARATVESTTFRYTLVVHLGLDSGVEHDEHVLGVHEDEETIQDGRLDATFLPRASNNPLLVIRQSLVLIVPKPPQERRGVEPLLGRGIATLPPPARGDPRLPALVIRPEVLTLTSGLSLLGSQVAIPLSLRFGSVRSRGLPLLIRLPTTCESYAHASALAVAFLTPRLV
jgi:hypothetical protein